jgi:hypothetical protein
MQPLRDPTGILLGGVRVDFSDPKGFYLHAKTQSNFYIAESAIYDVRQSGRV